MVLEMFMIGEYVPDENEKDTIVRCPLCGKGRIFDIPYNEKSSAKVKFSSSNASLANAVVLKCPKCRKKTIVAFSKEQHTLYADLP